MRISLALDNAGINVLNVSFGLVSGNNKQRFKATRGIRSYAPSLKEFSINKAKMVKEALDEIGGMLLKQVESGKIAVIEDKGLVLYDLSYDWTIE